MNKNELVLDRVRSLTFHELNDGRMLFRLTNLEDPSLNCTAEGDEVTDAVGALITTLYRAKKATFGATNSLISLDLAAAQYGTQKVVATSSKKIVDYAYEILSVDSTTHKVTLTHTPNVEIKYIYGIADREIGDTYEAAETAGTVNFVHAITGTGVNPKEITCGTSITGKVFVEYTYENEEAVSVRNVASKFPEAGSLIVYAYFRDRCDENTIYSGKIIAKKAKLNPEQVELALTSTGKHAFEFNIFSDYCDEEDDELFDIIVSDPSEDEEEENG